MTAEAAAANLKEIFGDRILSTREFRGEQTLVIDSAAVVDVCRHCRDHLKFDFLLDICSVDNSGEDPRFEMVYGLYSLEHNEHLRIKCALPEDDAEVDSLCDLWPGANWLEREVFDMMGIRFRNHPDPRRILMWEGYPYYPLRKEFPLGGKPSEMPDVAFTGIAPLEGGPFVTSPGPGSTVTREPRSHQQDTGEDV